MGDLIPKNTDDEMERYNEADMIRRARIPMESNAALVYEVDPVSKREVALFPLSSGGYVKIGERAVTPAQAAQTDVLAAQATVQNDGRGPIGMVLGEMATGPNAEGVRIDPTMEDYASAGYTEAEVIEYQNQKAVSPTTQFAVQLTPEQVQMGVDVGAPMLTTPVPGMFEGALSEVAKALAHGGLIEPLGFPTRFLKEKFNIYDPLVFQVVDPRTGEFDPQLRIVSREEKAEIDRAIAAGEMPYAVNFEDLFEAGDASQVGPGAQILGGISQFIGAFVGVGKIFRIGKGFTGAVTQGAAADFLGFGGDDGRLTDLLLELGMPENVVTDLLKTDPNDPDYVGRIKNAFEGGVLGAIAEPIARTIGMLARGGSRAELAQSIADLRTKSETAFSNGISDMIGAGRAVMQGDTEMLGEVFQPAGTARSLGAAAPDPNAAGAGAAGAGAAGAETTALARNTMEPRQVEVPTDERRGMIAFHGSGADFDRFELNKIGTGEKAQVFGRGLYFTDSEDIAEFYRQSVRGRQDLSLGYEVSYKGNKVVDLGDTPSAEVQPYENAAVNKIADNISRVTTMATRDLPQSELVQLAKDKAIKTLEGEIKKTAERTSGSMFDELTELIGNSLNDELKALRAINPNDVSFAEGKKYQVRLDVSPEELLNWDVPFDKQTPAAQRAIMKTADEITLDDAMNLGVDVFDAPYNGDEAAALDAAKKILLDDFSVNRFLNTWSDIRGSDGVGEELLAKNGLKGITYKADQGPTARDPSAGGPSNYVIFDDKLINIMKKYGIVGPVAVTGIASQEDTSNEI